MANRQSKLRGFVYCTGMGTEYIGVDPQTGLCYINAETFPNLPKAWQEYMKIHEEAHYVLQTANELQADDYAFYEYAKAGFPIHESVYVLTRILDKNNPEHQQRVARQMQRVIQYDYYINGNRAALN